MDVNSNLEKNIWGFYYGYYYQIYHPLTIVFCVSGILTNAINVVVLTRPRMYNSTNFIFTGIVIADLLLVASRGCRSVAYYVCPTVHQFVNTYTAMYVYGMYTIEYCSLLMSEWLSVVLGTWRLIAVTWPLKAQSLCSIKRAKIAVSTAMVAAMAISIPCIFVVSTKEVQYHGAPINLLTPWAFASAKYSNGHVVYLITLCICITVPILLLMVITTCLIWSTWRALKGRSDLNASMQKEGLNTNRTTMMLIIMLSTFVVTNAPAIVLTVAGLIPHYPTKFAITSYNNFFQSVLVFGSTTTFITYSYMSSKYRDTFSKLFFCRMIFPGKMPTRSGESTLFTLL